MFSLMNILVLFFFYEKCHVLFYLFIAVYIIFRFEIFYSRQHWGGAGNMLNVDFSFVRLSGHDIPFLLMDVTLRKRGREISPYKRHGGRTYGIDVCVITLVGTWVCFRSILLSYWVIIFVVWNYISSNDINILIQQSKFLSCGTKEVLVCRMVQSFNLITFYISPALN